MSFGVSFEVDCLLVWCYKEVNYDKYPSKRVRRLDGQPLPNNGLSPVVLHRPLSHFHLVECFDYWACDHDFEIRFHGQVQVIFAASNNFDLLGIPLSERLNHYIKTLGWWMELEGSRLLCVLTPPIFAYHKGHILKNHPRWDYLWSIVIFEGVVCVFIAFFGLACIGTRASVFGDSCFLNVKMRKMVSLHSPSGGRTEQYNGFELLCDSSLIINLGFLAYSRCLEVDWSRCKSS